MTLSMVLVLVLLGAVACRGDPGRDGQDDGAGAEVAGGRGPSRPGSDPPGTEPAAVEPHISELLLAYDRAVNEIGRDPLVAEDPDDPLVEEFLGLFPEDAPFAETMLDVWATRAAEGVRTVPYRDDLPATESNLDGRVETVSEDEVTFPVCVISRTRVVDEDGDEVRAGLPRVDNPGEGVAVRTDDGWRLREVEVSTGELQCREDR